MCKEYLWEIKVKSTPTLKRKCSRCNCDRFYCSKKFRINAQKKSLDVWLIYRCSECDSTYNLTLLSRTRPELIDKDLFEKFARNDEETAWKYAFSRETLQRNRVEPDYDSVEYEIVHEHISLKDLPDTDNRIVKFKIQTRFEFGLKLSTVIRTFLDLSASRFDRLVKAEVISTPKGYPLKKHKLKDGDIVLIDKEKLNIASKDTIFTVSASK